MVLTNVLLTTFNVENNFSLAFGYLKANALKNKSIAKKANIQIMDFSQEGNNVTQVLYYISITKPEIIGLSCYCWNMAKLEKLTNLIKKILPNSIIILGGPEVEPIASEYIKENSAVDIIVKGEGEITFSELLKYYILNQGSLKKIKGIVFRKNNQIYENDEQPLIENLDDIPSPYLTGALIPRDSVTYLETYRGCPYKCAYCYEGKSFPKLRYFSEDRIKKEIELILKNDLIHSFSFIDPVFNLKKEKTKQIVKIISELNINSKRLHTIEVICELIDEETVNLFKKINVESVETGPQTIEPETLKNIKRYFHREKFQRGFKLLLDNNINVISDLMIGLPGDNFFKFINSVKFVIDLKPSRLVFSTLHVLPGTHLYNEASKFGLVFEPKSPHCVLSTDSFSFQEIKKAEVFAESFQKEYNLKANNS